MKSTNISRISILWNIFSEGPFIIRNYRQNVFLSSCNCLQIQLLKVKNLLATGWAEKAIMPLYSVRNTKLFVTSLFFTELRENWGGPELCRQGRWGAAGRRLPLCPGPLGAGESPRRPFARWRRGAVPGSVLPVPPAPRVVRPLLRRGSGPTVLAVTSPRPLLRKAASLGSEARLLF